MQKIFGGIVIFLLIALFAIGGFLYLDKGRSEEVIIVPDVPPSSPSATPEKQEEISQNTTDFPLVLPEGFSISLFAKDLGPARAMAWDSAGNLLVSITKDGKVLALPDRNGDGVADRVATVVEGLNRPHGLLFFENKLYIAETNQVVVYEYNAQTLRALNKEKIIDLPSGGGHFTRTLLKTSDDRLLISVGSTCNVCVESDWRRAAVLVSNMDGSDLEVFASGLRNAVFMALHPETQEVWVTEMGRDFLGDNLPPDEINILGSLSTLREASGQASSGQNSIPNFGWPVCYGKNIHDTDFDKNTYIRNPCMEPFETPSHIDLQAHSAPLGLAFMPEAPHDLLVAYHGSWNREEPTGYKIVRIDEQGQIHDFISGWLQRGRAVGRPVDMLFGSDGVLYISDDEANVVYRVVYIGRENEL